MEYTVQLQNENREVIREARYIPTLREAKKVLAQMKRETPDFYAFAINEADDE